MGVRGSVAIERGERFAERLAALLGDLALRVVDEEQLDVARTLIVAPRFSSDAPALLAQRLGAPLENLAPIDLDGDPHSSTLALAWHAATAHGMVERFDRALFLLGGAGLTAAAAAYTVPRA
jgi:3-oxoacyl-[acyl-carrier-protein] synthase-3